VLNDVVIYFYYKCLFTHVTTTSKVREVTQFTILSEFTIKPSMQFGRRENPGTNFPHAFRANKQADTWNVAHLIILHSTQNGAKMINCLFLEYLRSQ
jgi:hypothetical protein